MPLLHLKDEQGPKARGGKVRQIDEARFPGQIEEGRRVIRVGTDPAYPLAGGRGLPEAPV